MADEPARPGAVPAGPGGAAGAAGQPALAPAWYARSPGTWRDWTSVLHLPYTAWHLSYVLIGAALAPRLSLVRLSGTLVAFALAVGLAAHALDELRGRPLGTAIPRPALVVVSAVALAGAVTIGIAGLGRVGWGLGVFMALGVILVLGYNLELAGGRLHTDVAFALAWGSFPLLTAYYAQAGTVRLSAVAGAAFAFGLSRAQRLLSTEARDLRRRVVAVDGEKFYGDGSRRPVTRKSLLGPVEGPLVALSWSICALGVGLVLARSGL